MRKKKVVLILGIILLLSGCCYLGVLKPPKAEWDKSPETIVISEGPYTLAEVGYDYIPKYRIWGNGYIVWVEYDEDKNRKVFHGYLTEEDMEQLVTRVVDKYFDIGRILTSKDGFPYNSLEITLLDGNYSEMIPPEDKELYEEIQFMGKGAGVKGTEFIPEIGELIVIPIKKTDYPDLEIIYSWPDEKFGYSLGDVQKRKEIEGEELLFAWQIANAPNSYIESNGETYWITIVVPKISYAPFQ